jgi:1,5-anhydro-D-fructose reductase (1,5-anhydro-D-mannitol-forming)
LGSFNQRICRLSRSNGPDCLAGFLSTYYIQDCARWRGRARPFLSHSREEHRMAGARQAAVGWGLIGASTIAAEWMIAGIRAAGGEPLSVMSRDAARAAAFAARHAVAHSTTSLDALLATEGVQAVYISTTNERHYDEALAAAARGKHVLCEKPLALALPQAVEMVRACENKGLVFATNHHLRNAATHRKMRELVASGALGRVHAMSINHAVQLPRHLQTWRIDKPEQGGGIFLDISVHDGDTARFLLDDEPAEVVAMAGSFGLGSHGLDDAAMYALRMGRGALVQVHESFVTPYGITGVEIHGSEGSIIACDVMTQRPKGTLVLRTAAGEQPIPVEHEDMYARAIRYFHAAMRGEGQPWATGWDGVRSLAVALAVAEAAGTGRRTPVSQLGRPSAARGQPS